MRLMFAISALALVGCSEAKTTPVSEGDVLVAGAYGDCSTVNEAVFKGASKQHTNDVKIDYNGNKVAVETRSLRKSEANVKSQDGESVIAMPKGAIAKITTSRGTEFLRADDNTRLIVKSGDTYTCRFTG
jgi:hypothetical protein